MSDILKDFSIEVMPRTLAKVDVLETLLPKGSRVYVAHIEGVEFQDMLVTAKRLSEAGYRVMPHIPARIVSTVKILESWVERYVGEANVSEALLLAGSPTTPCGDLADSMQLIQTGLFEKYQFKRLHIAGHPEGNKDIDPDGSGEKVRAALAWKQAYADQCNTDMAIVTQFAFDAHAVVDWADMLLEEGIRMPVHVGLAGPTKLQTLIKFAISCGVGPSLKILQKRAVDLTKLLTPYEPTEMLQDLSCLLRKGRAKNIAGIHFFPLGGINSTAAWARQPATSSPNSFD
mgnify:CR=1 FL=1